MSHELALWLPPAVIIGVMLYLHRSLREQIDSRMERMETRLSGRIDGLESKIGDLRTRMGRIEERMARLEGTLDVLREFFVGSGRGTAA